MLYALCAALSLALLGLDQWVKHYVTVNIPLGEAQPFLPGLVELRTVHNYGAAWSSFSGMRWLLVAVTSVIVIAVAVVLLRRIVHCHQKVGKADNGIKRRTYFMADICQKSGLQPVGLFRFIAGCPELCLCFFLDRYVIVHLY